MIEKLFSEIPEEIKRQIRESLERAGYERVSCSVHQNVLGENPHFSYEGWATLTFEADQHRRVEGKEVLVLPEELVGGRRGFYAFYARERKDG